ncbi:MAG: acetolactate synthase small subunit [Candidatus Marinimicrobia bacterium]|nr:acetolactate synthase small subunit [Candidatus Neomarinimicrobiota bacterium]MDD5582845.1 acetolactate synthase small subunit [Candidatus Neomarinimicrobiota bacterium]
MKEKHTIIVTVINSPGVLARISGLLYQRGFNIESAIAAPTEDPKIYKVILVVEESDEYIEQIVKQLNKLIDTIRVVDISHKDNYIVREYIILKLDIQQKNRTDLLELSKQFNAHVIDISIDHIIIELSGNPQKIDRFIELVRPFGIKEYVRSGEFAMAEYQKSKKGEKNGS